VAAAAVGGSVGGSLAVSGSAGTDAVPALRLGWRARAAAGRYARAEVKERDIRGGLRPFESRGWRFAFDPVGRRGVGGAGSTEN
jgi:hypothetical protein